jgi:transposase
MNLPLFVRPLSDPERQQLQAGLRSPVAFTVRRCQILLSSANGVRPAQIARNLACARGTVRNAIHAFHTEGTSCLREKSSRPHSLRSALDDRHADALRDLLHLSPRLCGKPTSLWTLELLAEVCQARGWTPRRYTGEAVRVALKRLGISWRRAKHWITSPDPAYARKKTRATG